MVRSEQTYQKTELYDQFINELKSVWIGWSFLVNKIRKRNTADFEQAKLQQAAADKPTRILDTVITIWS